MINKRDDFGFEAEGHVLIKSYDETWGDEIVVLNKRNAVHKENFSIAVSRSLSGNASGRIYSLSFGTGGATIDSLNNIVYASPNVVGSADLNTPVYFEVVDHLRGAPKGNQVSTRHLSGTLFSDIEVRCILDKTEPSGQELFDNVSGLANGQFTFSEMGLKTDDGLLLTHITFAPIMKSANRILEVIYTLRIRMV